MCIVHIQVAHKAVEIIQIPFYSVNQKLESLVLPRTQHELKRLWYVYHILLSYGDFAVIAPLNQSRKVANPLHHEQGIQLGFPECS